MNKPRIMILRNDRAEWPRCEALLSIQTRQFWYGRGRPQNEEGSDHCRCFAKYKINGKFLCRKHAGLYLLDIMTGATKC